MDLALTILAVALLLVVAAAGWALTLLGMPGTWLMVAGAALYAWLGPSEGVLQLGWSGVLFLAVVAALGEIAETASGMLIARRAGGSRRAAWFSLAGSFAGALVGAGLGAPLPVVGPMAGAVLGGALGAMAGAAAGEYSRGERHGHSLQVGRAAFRGRLVGTGAKVVAASLLVVSLVVGLFW